MYVGMLQPGGMTSSNSLGGRRLETGILGPGIERCEYSSTLSHGKPCVDAWQASLDKLLTGQYLLLLTNMVCLHLVSGAVAQW